MKICSDVPTTAENKALLKGWDTTHTLLIRGTIRVGTPHNIEKKQVLNWVVGLGSYRI